VTRSNKQTSSRNSKQQNRTQRAPETVDQLESWSRRMGDYKRSGVGADDCLTGTCHIQGAYASGQGYGPPSHEACPPCAGVMETWPTRLVAGTNYHRVPRGGVARATHRQGTQAGPVIPAQRSAGQETATEVTA
jgi:hypothetical protein